MAAARYFVFRHGDEWVVSLEGRALARAFSREAALQSAIIMADLMGSMRYESDVVVDADGRLDFVWTYGTDAPPRSMAPSLGAAA